MRKFQNLIVGMSQSEMKCQGRVTFDPGMTFGFNSFSVTVVGLNDEIWSSEVDSKNLGRVDGNTP